MGKLLAEAMLLCNEAAWRRLGKDRGGSQTNQRTELSPPGAKPLMLEYISDRIDTDEPPVGYAVRTQREAWFQGFVCVTQFTTWCEILIFAGRRGDFTLSTRRRPHDRVCVTWRFTKVSATHAVDGPGWRPSRRLQDPWDGGRSLVRLQVLYAGSLA